VVERVRAVLGGLEDVGALIVVNDGSTDDTGARLQDFEGVEGVTVLSHPRNLGKGAALLSAFRYASDKGFTHALTVDADGQHEASDIPRVLTCARDNEQDLIIGWRDMESPKDVAGVRVVVPANSKKGRDISRFWLRIETGQDIPDSQCGLRVYPLAHVLAMRYRFLRFDFETEVLARLAWSGVTIRSVPVTCIYFPPAVRVSHFRPVRDTLRGIRVNVFLVARRLAPLPFPRRVERPSMSAEFGSWWRWSSWKNACRKALQTGTSNAEFATAISLGIFVGLTPLFFLQTILAIYLARRLHLNVIAAVLGSQISIPPVAPLWYVISAGTGNFILRGEWIRFDYSALSRETLWAYVVGSMVVATVGGILSLILSRQLLSRLRPETVTVSES
jgi:glycosyltransferase involved in cell wall biosynthesis